MYAGEIKRAGRSTQHIECAKCIHAIPECPQPAVPIRSAFDNASTAFANASISIASLVARIESLSIVKAARALSIVSAFMRNPPFLSP